MKLAFVYNAKKGWFNALADSVHKVWSPDTYPCDLCSITHGVTGMRNIVKNWLQRPDIEAEFYYLNHLEEGLKSALQDAGGAPAVFIEQQNDWVLIFDSTTLSTISDPEIFLKQLEGRLAG